MHKSLPILIFTVSLLCLAQVLPLRAEEAAGKSPAESRLTLERCISISLKNNFTLKDALEQLLEKEADYYIARNTLQTTVTASFTAGSTSDPYAYEGMNAGGNLTYKLPEGDTVKASVNAVQNNFATYGGHNANIEYRYPLARGNGLVVGSQPIRKAQRNLTIQEMNYFISKQGVVFDVVSRYFALLQARKLIEVNVGSLAAAKENLRITKRKFEEGLVPKIDLTRAELLYVNAEDGLLSSRKTWSDLRDTLVRSLGLDPRESLDIDYEVPYVPRDFQEDECVELSMVLRKELLVTGEQLFQNKEDVVMAKDALKPKMDLVASYATLRTPVINSIGDPITYPAWSAMLECSVDISKRQLREDLLKSKRLVVLQQDKLANQKLDVVREVREGLRSIRLAASRVELMQTNLKAAEERLHLATRSWEEGLIQNREVVDAQNDKVTAQVNLVQAKINYILAEYALRRAIGYDLAFMIREEEKVKKEQGPRKSSVNHFLGVGTK